MSQPDLSDVLIDGDFLESYMSTVKYLCGERGDPTMYAAWVISSRTYEGTTFTTLRSS